MSMIKQMALQIPGMKAIQRRRWKREADRRLQSQTPEEVFSEIYQNNAWSGQESRSGTGSDSTQTQTIANAIPDLLRRFNLSSMLDVPCGDFRWMKDVNLEGIQYIGADIVPEIVLRNEQQFGNDWQRFQQLDLIRDTIPTVDLIFCRDCLVHLSHQAVQESLRNICDSGSKFLLTTTFPNRTVNEDILTGQWRVLNLEMDPFNFPSPIELLNEQFTEGDGAYHDKSLGLWRISDLDVVLP